MKPVFSFVLILAGIIVLWLVFTGKLKIPGV